MVYVVAALALLFQDSDLAAGSRQVFAPLIDFALDKGRLVIKSTVAREKLHEALDCLSEKLPVSHGTCESGGCSQSWSGGGTGGHANISFEPSDRPGVFGWSYETAGGRESLELRQAEPGILRLVFQNEDLLAVFRQRKDGRCTLLVDNGHESSRWQADSFNALLAEQGEAVVANVLAPLERYFDDAPLSPYSPKVIEMALAVAPVTAEEARDLDRLVEKLKVDEIETREAAEVELRTRIAGSPSCAFAVALRSEASTDGEVKARLEAALGAAPRRREICKMVAGQGLFRDLGYLSKLWSSGRPAKARLEALTGRTFATAEEGAAWVQRNASKLKWVEEMWRYKD